MKKIIDKIIKSELVDWRRLVNIQGSGFKELSVDAYKKLRESMIQNDFIAPFKVYEENDTQYIIDGVHRVKVLHELEKEGVQVPPKLRANFIDCKDKKEAAALVLVYSSIYAKTLEEGIYQHMNDYSLDYKKIKAMTEIPNIDYEKFEAGYLKDIIPAEGEDDVPPAPVEAKSKIGDLIELGNHRLFCGDCTVKENVDKLMGGEKADMVYCDPPYGISLDTGYHGLMKSNVGKKFPRRESVGVEKNYKPVENDGKEFKPEFIFEYFNYCKEVFLWGANNFIHLVPDYQAGSWVCWDKKTETLDRMITSDFELCWSKKRHKYAIVRIVWSGIFGSDEGKAGHKKVHPTQKPIKLTEWIAPTAIALAILKAKGIDVNK